MFGSRYWVSLFLVRGYFSWPGISGEKGGRDGCRMRDAGCSGDGRIGEEGKAGSWTTITLSANPITVAAH